MGLEFVENQVVVKYPFTANTGLACNCLFMIISSNDKTMFLTYHENFFEACVRPVISFCQYVLQLSHLPIRRNFAQPIYAGIFVGGVADVSQRLG